MAEHQDIKPGPTKVRHILHVDMDAFFASVEILDDPSLVGKPVIVGGTPEGRGVVSAASYEARKFGVHSAMSAARARKLCPNGVFLRGRMSRYLEISKQIQNLFHDFTPLVEPLSVDEAFLDVSGCVRLLGSAEDIGHSIKDRIAREIGLVASVGVAPNKFLAKLASDLDKPDGFVVITNENAREILAALPVGRLWGVGKVMQQEMNAAGIVLVSDMLAIPIQQLVDRFGSHVLQLRKLALGIDDRSVIPAHEVKSIGNEETFAEDISDQDELFATLDYLSQKVAQRLRSHDFEARTITLKARYSDFTTFTRSFTLTKSTNSSVVIRDTVRNLLTAKLGRKGRALRLVGVSTANFTRHQEGQTELFCDPTQERDREIDRLVDQVKNKFGDKLSRGAKPERKRR